ncbi:MAG TPA: polysaccharide deacetylase family protein [bacterium]|nr:polysaccharide deacetylase family protein [bacterium]
MNRNCLCFLFSTIFIILTATAQAQNNFPQLKVVPWNGHKAATSLTFDDGDPIHLDVVVPELNRRQLHGTFFLIANKIDRKDEWRQAIKAGHEIGNHTLDHLHANTLTPQGENAQVVGAQNVLQKEFGVPVYSFAYPFGEISQGLADWVAKTSFIARGGTDALVSPQDKAIDWLNLPAKVTLTKIQFKTYQGWMDQDLKSRDWLIWMIHGIEGTPWGWEPISRKMFTQILDYLQSKDIWVGTLTEVGSYLRAWRSFEVATIQVTGSEAVYHWVVSDHFPMNVWLKVNFAQEGTLVQVWQNDQKIVPDAQGNYRILFNLGQLSLRR